MQPFMPCEADRNLEHAEDGAFLQPLQLYLRLPCTSFIVVDAPYLVFLLPAELFLGVPARYPSNASRDHSMDRVLHVTIPAVPDALVGCLVNIPILSYLLITTSCERITTLSSVKLARGRHILSSLTPSTRPQPVNQASSLIVGTAGPRGSESLLKVKLEKLKCSDEKGCSCVIAVSGGRQLMPSCISKSLGSQPFCRAS